MRLDAIIPTSRALAAPPFASQVLTGSPARLILSFPSSFERWILDSTMIRRKFGQLELPVGKETRLLITSHIHFVIKVRTNS